MAYEDKAGESWLLGGLIAHNNRSTFSNQGILVINNVLNLPGFGKTTILENTILRLIDQINGFASFYRFRCG